MRIPIVPFLVLVAACTAPRQPQEPTGPDRWSGTYRYGGTRTELRREGRYYRFSDARLGGFYFRLTDGGFLEDDRQSEPVRVMPDVRDDTSKTDRPYRSLRIIVPDDTLILLRIP